jgi:hypothetical protein
MFRQLDYQDRVTASLDAYLDLLKAKKERAGKVAALAAQDPDLDLAVPDFAKEAWEAMKAVAKLPPSRAAIPFSPRWDGCDRPVPNAVLKVPAGGGKTWLAVLALETKGDQLDNLDTAYKREALDFLSRHFKWDDAIPVGELQLVNSGETVEGTLILISEWRAKLPAYL